MLKANKLYNRLEDFKKLYEIKIYLDKDEFPEWKDNSKVLHIEVCIYLDNQASEMG
jgi:hypothetical protein